MFLLELVKGNLCQKKRNLVVSNWLKIFRDENFKFVIISLLGLRKMETMPTPRAPTIGHAEAKFIDTVIMNKLKVPYIFYIHKTQQTYCYHYVNTHALLIPRAYFLLLISLELLELKIQSTKSATHHVGLWVYVARSCSFKNPCSGIIHPFLLKYEIFHFSS